MIKTTAFAILAATGFCALSATGVTLATISSASAQEVQINSQIRAENRKKGPNVRAARGARHIACTPAGCGPVPRGCYPTPGYSWNGNPTGYDAVVCR